MGGIEEITFNKKEALRNALLAYRNECARIESEYNPDIVDLQDFHDSHPEVVSAVAADNERLIGRCVAIIEQEMIERLSDFTDVADYKSAEYWARTLDTEIDGSTTIRYVLKANSQHPKVKEILQKIAFAFIQFAPYQQDSGQESVDGLPFADPNSQQE